MEHPASSEFLTKLKNAVTNSDISKSKAPSSEVDFVDAVKSEPRFSHSSTSGYKFTEFPNLSDNENSSAETSATTANDLFNDLSKDTTSGVENSHSDDLNPISALKLNGVSINPVVIDKINTNVVNNSCLSCQLLREQLHTYKNLTEERHKNVGLERELFERDTVADMRRSLGMKLEMKLDTVCKDIDRVVKQAHCQGVNNNSISHNSPDYSSYVTSLEDQNPLRNIANDNSTGPLASPVYTGRNLDKMCSFIKDVVEHLLSSSDLKLKQNTVGAFPLSTGSALYRPGLGPLSSFLDANGSMNHLFSRGGNVNTHTTEQNMSLNEKTPSAISNNNYTPFGEVSGLGPVSVAPPPVIEPAGPDHHQQQRGRSTSRERLRGHQNSSNLQSSSNCATDSTGNHNVSGNIFSTLNIGPSLACPTLNTHGKDNNFSALSLSPSRGTRSAPTSGMKFQRSINPNMRNLEPSINSLTSNTQIESLNESDRPHQRAKSADTDSNTNFSILGNRIRSHEIQTATGKVYDVGIYKPKKPVGMSIEEMLRKQKELLEYGGKQMRHLPCGGIAIVTEVVGNGVNLKSDVARDKKEAAPDAVIDSEHNDMAQPPSDSELTESVKVEDDHEPVLPLSDEHTKPNFSSESSSSSNLNCMERGRATLRSNSPNVAKLVSILGRSSSNPPLREGSNPQPMSAMSTMISHGSNYESIQGMSKSNTNQVQAQNSNVNHTEVSSNLSSSVVASPSNLNTAGSGIPGRNSGSAETFGILAPGSGGKANTSDSKPIIGSIETLPMSSSAAKKGPGYGVFI